MEKEQSSFIFDAIIIKEMESYSALCLDVDVASQANTIEEAKGKLSEAVSLYVESAIESNLPIIRPVPRDENPLLQHPQDVVAAFKVNVNINVATYV